MIVIVLHCQLVCTLFLFYSLVSKSIGAELGLVLHQKLARLLNRGAQFAAITPTVAAANGAVAATAADAIGTVPCIAAGAGTATATATATCADTAPALITSFAFSVMTAPEHEDRLLISEDVPEVLHAVVGVVVCRVDL